MLIGILLSGIVTLLLIYLIDIWKKRKYKAITRKYGGTKGLPLLGLALRLTKGNEFHYDWPKLIQNTNSQSAFVWYITTPTFCTQNPDFAERVFLSPDCNVKAGVYDLLHKELGPGLITLGGSEWSHHRKIINPSFNQRMLLSFFPKFNQKSTLFLRELETLVGKGEVEMYKCIQNFAIKTAFVTFFGMEMNEHDGRLTNFLYHVDRFWVLFLDRLVIMSKKFGFIYRFSKFYQPYTESKQYVMDFMRDMLKEMKMNRWTSTEGDNIKTNKTDHRFINLVLDSHQKDIFSWNDFYFEALTILFSGFETSATTLYSILVFLAMHPQYQERLFEEIVALYPDKEFDVKYEDLKHLVYMDMVFNETLRVAPTIPLIGRVVTKDLKMAEDSVLPTGTTVLIDLFNMHRRKDIWGPNAELFNPDNFLPGNLEAKHSCCYVPFAKGARNCIGWRYAGYFVKCSLAKIIRNFRFTTKFRYENLHYHSHITIDFAVKPLLEVHRR